MDVVDEEPTGEEQVPDSPRERRLELVITILLAFAALLSAWCAYGATRFNGEQVTLFQNAAELQVDAARTDNRADTLTQIDVIAFTGWLDATGAGNTALAEFYRERFRDEFRSPFATWLAADPLGNPDAPATPFELAEYRPALALDAETLRTAAAEAVQLGERQGSVADTYVLAAVLFAASLFLLGIQSRIGVFELRLALVSVGGAMVVGTLLWLFTLPSLWPW